MPEECKSSQQQSIGQLHWVISMIAREFDAFCAEHSITYYLMGGTALGAMRHGGFIPWDDDFDVFMDRSNYLKFLETCDIHLDRTKYYLQREDTDEWPLYFSKIRLNDTLYLESADSGRTMHSGVYIDVMCLHNVHSVRVLRSAQYLAARILSAIALARRGYEPRSPLKRMAIGVARMLDWKPVKAVLKGIVRHLDGASTELVGHFFGRAPFRATCFPRVYLGTPRRVKFGDMKLPVPDKVEQYLTLRYGERYMEEPSAAVRAMFPAHAAVVDLGPYAAADESAG
jgi:lipopolysaccharide cholinephosphotransferase